MLPPSDDAAGEVDLEVDNEDTEDKIEALVMEVEAALADMPPDSPVVKLASLLLLKVHRFIAKVCYTSQDMPIHPILLCLTVLQNPNCIQEHMLQFR